MKEIYIIDAKRTAIGSFCGIFNKTPAHILGSTLIKALYQNNKIDPGEISEIIMGQVLVGGLGQNPARQASMEASVPEHVPSFGVSKVCGSGLKAIGLAFQAIRCGDANIIIAGGQENMSMAHHSFYARGGIKLGSSEFTDMMQYDGLTDAFSKKLMGVTAENIVRKFNISRDEQDEYALISQQKASKAQKEGAFDGEIIQVGIEVKKELIQITKDEFIRHDASIDSLKKLKPAFEKDGTVTPGNSSGINDGAAALLIMDKETMLKYGLKPLARIVSYASAGVDPEIMGTGPVKAVPKALAKAGWRLEDLDLIEANEAFAAQSIAVNRELGWDLTKVNIKGGAIALGHPIGASGARILVSLVHSMQSSNAKKGVATLCIGGGMGIAMCIEKA